MKFNCFMLMSLTLCFGSCSDEYSSSPGDGAHYHAPPHGGALVELGEHGSGYNLELFLEDEGLLQIFVWDAHVDNLVRIEQEKIDLLLSNGNVSDRTLTCSAVEDAATGETVGNTSLFSSNEKIAGQLPLKGVIPMIKVIGKTYENIPFEFNGNSVVHNDDH